MEEFFRGDNPTAQRLREKALGASTAQLTQTYCSIELFKIVTSARWFRQKGFILCLTAYRVVFTAYISDKIYAVNFYDLDLIQLFMKFVDLENRSTLLTLYFIIYQSKNRFHLAYLYILP